MIYPFHFISSYRKEYFLFGKIFDSIINKKKIEVGNLNFYQDIVHAQYMVEKIIETENDTIIGSGRLCHVGDFIKDLYKHFDLDFNYYVRENNAVKNNHSKKLFYSQQKRIFSYDDLLKYTIKDIKERWKKLE
jgi:GDP-D-mannose dehydratase